MARRIDIELTSARPDGSWTWRAAGAMQPRGVLEGELLYPGAKAGDVARADAEFEIDGIVIVSVTAPKEKKRAEPERIELITPAASGPAVTTQLVGRGGGRSFDRRGDRDDRPRRDDRQGPRRDGAGGRPPRDGAPGRPARRPEGADGGASRQGGRPPAGARDGGGRDGGERRRAPTTAGSADGRPGRPRSERPARSEAEADTGARAAARRLNPGNTHRQAVMASLSSEQQPIAEQVLRGGIPAVRTAIHLEREKAAAEGRAEPNADSILAIAEDVLPRLKAAEWRDRAEAAAKAGDDLALRDLRSVVAGADLARDDETRQLAVTLREALETRLTTMRQAWVDEITTQLDEGRVVRALRVAARAPEATTRMSAEQAQRLAVAAGAAMSPDTAPDRWAALLEAVAASPVRRSVAPVGLPAEPGAALLSAAQQQAGRIPALAALLGISMPPPPGPVRPAGSGRPAAPRRGRPTDRRPADGQGPEGRPTPPPASRVPATEPVAAQPVESTPADTAPVATEPAPVEATPADTDSVASEPAPVEAVPVETPPVETPPVETDSVATEPVLVETPPVETVPPAGTATPGDGSSDVAGADPEEATGAAPATVEPNEADEPGGD